MTSEKLGPSFDTTTVVRELHAEVQALKARVAMLEATKAEKAPPKPQKDDKP